MPIFSERDFKEREEACIQPAIYNYYQTINQYINFDLELPLTFNNNLTLLNTYGHVSIPNQAFAFNAMTQGIINSMTDDLISNVMSIVHLLAPHNLSIRVVNPNQDPIQNYIDYLAINHDENIVPFALHIPFQHSHYGGLFIGVTNLIIPRVLPSYPVFGKKLREENMRSIFTGHKDLILFYFNLLTDVDRTRLYNLCLDRFNINIPLNQFTQNAPQYLINIFVLARREIDEFRFVIENFLSQVVKENNIGDMFQRGAIDAWNMFLKELFSTIFREWCHILNPEY